MVLPKGLIFPLYMRYTTLPQNTIVILETSHTANKSVKPNQVRIVYNKSKETVMRPKLLYALIILSLIIIVLAPIHT